MSGLGGAVAGDRVGRLRMWVDLRLAPVAAAVWVVSAVAPVRSPTELWLGAGAATGTAVAVAWRWGGPLASIALAVLAGLAVASVAGALRGAALQASPVRAVAEAGARCCSSSNSTTTRTC